MSASSLLVGLLPVLLFLLGLIAMDSYKLVARRSVLLAIALGGLCALAAFVVNRVALETLHVPPAALKRYLAPLIEETLKALYVVHLIRSEKAGFMVDAAILGFGVGAGFALVENVYYADALGHLGLPLWLVRGLGTAVMHGSTTAVVAVLSKGLADRHGSKALHLFLPGLALAWIVHAGFNHVLVNPLISTALLLLVAPLLLLVVFERSEKATRDWLGTGLDSDAELLDLIHSGEIANTRVGRYLDALKHRFPGQVVADMLCLLQIHLELSLRAKGLLIARAAGLDPPLDQDARANFAEMKYLERSIGETGLIAILPLRRTSSRGLWQLYVLKR